MQRTPAADIYLIKFDKPICQAAVWWYLFMILSCHGDDSSDFDNSIRELTVSFTEGSSKLLSVAPFPYPLDHFSAVKLNLANQCSFLINVMMSCINSCLTLNPKVICKKTVFHGFFFLTVVTGIEIKHIITPKYINLNYVKSYIYHLTHRGNMHN